MSRVFITTDAIGGVWSYSLALAAGLSDAGLACTLAVLGPPPQPHQRADAAAICTLLETGLPLDWITPTPTTLAETARTLANLATQTGATTAQLHAPCLAASPWPIPAIATAHSCMATWWKAVRNTPLPADFASHAEATRAGLQNATGIIAPTHAFAADLRRAYAPACDIMIIHNGLPTPPLNTAAREPFILTAGRLWDEGKNIAILDTPSSTPIQAAGPLASPDGAHFTPTHITPLGNLPAAELQTLMSRAAIFAAPSLYEPFGLSVLEAAQTGSPLVLADIPTFRELWTGAALFVPPRDPAAWTETLAQLMADPAAQAALGQAAQTRSAAYTRRAMATATAALHTNLNRTRQAA